LSKLERSSGAQRLVFPRITDSQAELLTAAKKNLNLVRPVTSSENQPPYLLRFKVLQQKLKKRNATHWCHRFWAIAQNRAKPGAEATAEHKCPDLEVLSVRRVRSVNHSKLELNSGNLAPTTHPGKDRESR